MTFPAAATLPAFLLPAALLFTFLATRLSPPGGHLPFAAGALASALLAWQLFVDLRSPAGPKPAPPRQSRLLLLLGLLLAVLPRPPRPPVVLARSLTRCSARTSPALGLQEAGASAIVAAQIAGHSTVRQTCD